MDKKQIDKITNYIFLEEEPQHADIAMIFGTKYDEPVYKVYDLYKKKYTAKIILSGGINRKTGENEAIRMQKILLDLGVNKNDIILEKNSTNTLENVLFSKKIIDNKIGLDNIKKMIVIVKNYHSRRVLMTLKKHFPTKIKIIPISYNLFNFTKNNWFKNEIGQEKVMGEYKKIKKYLAKGDIEELD